MIQFTAEQEADICARYEQGEPMHRIAVDHPCSVGPIRKVLVRNGVQIRVAGPDGTTATGYHRRTFDHDEARRLMRTGWFTLQALGDRYGVTRERIRQVVGADAVDEARAVQRAWRKERKALRREHHQVRTLWKNAHGTTNRYRKCRDCDACRKANTARVRQGAAERYVLVVTDPTHPDIPHGTPSGYQNWGCRCVPCRKAQQKDQQEYRARKKAEGKAHPERIPHGTPSGYQNWGCRCKACVRFMRGEWNRKNRQRASVSA